MPVHIEERGIGPHLFADAIRQPADSKDVSAPIQAHAIFKIEALASQYLFGNSLQTLIVSLKRMPL